MYECKKGTILKIEERLPNNMSFKENILKKKPLKTGHAFDLISPEGVDVCNVFKLSQSESSVD